MKWLPTELHPMIIHVFFDRETTVKHMTEYPDDDAIALTQTERSIQDQLPMIVASGVILLSLITIVLVKQAPKKCKHSATSTMDSSQSVPPG